MKCWVWFWVWFTRIWWHFSGTPSPSIWQWLEINFSQSFSICWEQSPQYIESQCLVEILVGWVHHQVLVAAEAEQWILVPTRAETRARSRTQYHIHLCTIVYCALDVHHRDPCTNTVKYKMYRCKMYRETGCTLRTPLKHVHTHRTDYNFGKA